MAINEVVVERKAISKVEYAAKEAISTVKARKAELKELSESLEKIFLESNDYSNGKKIVKETNQIIADAKKNVLRNDSEAIRLTSEIKKLKEEVNYVQGSLFDYLLELKNETGQTTITDNIGETHEITVSAKIKI